MLSRNGGAGEQGLRTSFAVKLVLGIPLPQHRLAPFVVDPFRFTWRATAAEDGSDSTAEERGPVMRHPICRVLQWQNRLKSEAGLTQAQIGVDEGFSKSRMTQLFSLLSLHEDAQQYLASLTSPVAIKAFVIRRLMAVAKLPAGQQTEIFENMKAGVDRTLG